MWLRLSRCQDVLPVPVLTTAAPVRAQETLYVTTLTRLYAVNASDGTIHWCQQVTLMLPKEYKLLQSKCRASSASYGYSLELRKVTNDVVYVCASGYGKLYLCFQC